MLPKKYRLPAKDFPKVYKNGMKFRGKYGMLISMDNSLNSPFFGFVVSKKVGNSVQRHKVTRRLRSLTVEAIQELDLLTTGKSFSYISFEYTDDFKELKKEFFDQLKRAIQ